MSSSNEPTGVDDSWLAAVGAWTQGILGNEWSVYLNEWPGSYSTPAIMWRVSGMDLRQLGMSSYELEKQLVATAVGSTRNEEAAAVLKLTEAFGAAAKIPLSTEERRYLSISNPKVSLKSNAATTETTDGQLTVTLTRRTGSYPAQEVSLMQSVHYKSNMR
ncbi:hypothetical protein FHR92_004111 [Fontibacillus solani]|uniref:Uncharacterized protein n=1 Tax=Fontibacillus solani TaxID=1572857 RepID=A0A7W3SWQ5_9BACL|nr:hypothetical protein [Fontibacillus solani]MBA9087626.1 hypothetical protein [Fontibacillus solani]